MGNIKYNEIVSYCNNFVNIDKKNRISVAVMDTGVYPHVDLEGRIVAFKDLINGRNVPYDDNGHGTHISGIIAGSGRGNRLYRGINPGCNIVGVKVLNKLGNGKVDDVLKGVEYVIENMKKYNIRIVNISMGTEVDSEDEEMHKLIEGVERLWDAGIIVIASAGNNGPGEGSVTAPGISKKIITIGAVESKYSGRGPTYECIMKPDIVTDGSNIISLDNSRTGYMERSGTSMATAVVSGVVSLCLDKCGDTSPKEIKRRIIKYAKDVENGELIISKLLTCL